MQLNMPQNNNIEITVEDIEYAESILLKKWCTFDEERINFIKNLETIDLQAVPWSWKTTALLAKLLILERKMPFENGKGILVLSHTNTAVEEIKDKLWKIAPKLFDFPNFIWTIQEFVNKYLSKPFYVNILNKSIRHIDNDIYISNFYKYFPRQYLIWLKHKFWNSESKFLEFITSYQISKDSWKIINFYSIGEINLGMSDTTNTYIELKSAKKKLYSEWIICFNDAYYLWNKYIKKFPKIKKLLQKRFNYIFVDEMQDMQSHQVEILEELFYRDADSESKLQRIWDSNQAIYDWIVSVDCKWKWRDEITWNPVDILKLSWSHRLTKKIWDVVQCFSLVDNELSWKRKILGANDEDIAIKPILLVYSDNHINNPDPGAEVKNNQLLEAFTKIIEEKKNERYFVDIEEDKIVCKAIIWNAKPELDWSWDSKFSLDKCRAKHYYYDYDIAWKTKFKTWFKSEKDYLVYFNHQDTTYKSKYNNLINLLLRILTNNDIKNTDDKFFNKTSLFRFLNENNEENYLELKTKLFDLSKRLNNTNIDEIAGEIDVYFPTLIAILPWGQSIPPLRIKDSTLTPWVIIETTDDKKKNFYSNNWIEVNIGTVHSVKWETHTCTMYMESSSNWYESFPKLKWKFYSWEWITSSLWVRWKEALKMLYVWLSRPTHLLCYAIHKDRYDEMITVCDVSRLRELWEVQIISN